MIFSKKNHLLLFTAIVFLIGLYCFNPFELYFQNDDFIHIPLSAEGKLFQHNSFRPVCDLSVMLDYFLWKKNAFGYHLTNLLIHIADTGLLFIFCTSLFKRYHISKYVFEASLLAALLFFINPNHSEAIFWILGRSASLGVFFFLLSLIFYLKRAQKKYFFLSILFAIISWLTYESTWILPIVFVIISITETKLKGSTLKVELFRCLLIIFFFLFYLFARFFTIHELVGDYEGQSFLQINLKALADNFITLVLRSFMPPMKNLELQILICIVSVLTFSFIFLIKKKVSSMFFLPLIFFIWLIALLPAASLGVDTYSVEGERFLYLPSLLFCIMLSLFLVDILSQKKAAFVMISLIAFSLFFLYQSRSNYVFAGNITRSLLNEIKSLQDNKILINNLPQSQNGALIFNKGFSEAVNWITNKNADSIHILSFRDKKLQMNFPYKILRQQVNIHQPVFSFTDSALIISKSWDEDK